MVTKFPLLKTLTRNTVLAFLLLIFALPSSAQSVGSTFTIGSFKYTVTTAADGEGTGGEVSVAKNGNSSSAIVIPSTVTNTSTGITYSVTSIANRGFNWCSTTPSITIPEGVTSIGESAFSDCRVATTINIPNSVISIGESAFNNCYALTGITIPSGVTTIPRSAFYNCDALTSITIPSGVTTIGRYAFAYCNNLADITFTRTETTPTIGDNVLTGLIAGVTTVHVPTGMVADYKEAFNWESSGYSDSYFITDGDGVLVVTVGGLKYGVVDAENHTAKALGSSSASGSITIASSVSGFGSGAEQSESYTVTSIGGSAFQNCTGLTSVTIPNGVTSIGSSAFYGCSGLTSVAIPNTVTSIGNSAFSGCSGLTSVIIPNGVTSIGSSAFYGCSGLTSVTISNSLTSIAGSTFFGCSGLTSITIPNSVTSISNSAFQNCTGLTSVALGTGVASINQYAFSKCSSLSSISVEDGNTSYSSEDGILYNYSKTTLVICPNGKTGSITIPNTVTSIGNSAFSGCSGLTSITIPEGITSIGESTFSGCSGLTSITIPNRVTSIKSLAFFNCPSLTSVTMERSTPPTLSSIDVFPYSNAGFTIYVPCGSKTAYTSATNWSNSSISSKITDALPAEITEDRYLESCDCDFPSTITIKDGASLSASPPSSLSTKLSGKTVNVEKDLAIDEFSLIGNIGGETDYDFIASNIGDNSGLAHSMVALPFNYSNNSWGVEDGSGARNGVDIPVSDGESFFVYPTTNQYNTNGTTINGDTYTTLTQSISSSNL
ncbi:MAG: leucine-rich repeat domain-containing protein, partial [Bacteroidales bacterium]|nr:leucine-rich repeat domain-containing protein [Bacteroidales bacterium]